MSEPFQRAVFGGRRRRGIAALLAIALVASTGLAAAVSDPAGATQLPRPPIGSSDSLPGPVAADPPKTEQRQPVAHGRILAVAPFLRETQKKSSATMSNQQRWVVFSLLAAIFLIFTAVVARCSWHLAKVYTESRDPPMSRS